MLAPSDKIKSGVNRIIQILTTRACDLFHCSNCTQLLPLREDTVHMDIDVFRRAVQSLEGWPGIYGLFGGNPCVHPRFPDLCQILIDEGVPQNQRGLWTNNFMGHGAVIRDTFYPNGMFNLNAHAEVDAYEDFERWCPGKAIKTARDNESWHSPILLDYRDFNVSEDEWIQLRENCDINQKWSAAIMERNGEPRAYFCEVAGAIDGIRGTDNSVPCDDLWWKQPMQYFESQVGSCCDAGCGVPLRRKGNLDRDDTYDYSPKWSDVVELRIKGHKVLHKELPEGTEEATDYQGHRSKK